MSEIKNSKYINITSGTCRVTVLAEDTSTRKVNIFSTLISTPDSGISLPLDTTLGRTRELNDIYNSVGNFSGTTTGNEVVNDKTVNLSFADDFVQLSDSPAGMEVSKNVLLNMLLGESFTANTGAASVIQNVVGTNGTVKRTKKAVSGHDFGLMFDEIGKLKVPQAKDENGKSILEQNVRVTGYNTSALCVMFEVFTEFDANHKQGLCFAYVLNGNAEWTEDTDYNKLSVEGQILCDIRYTNGYLIDGFGFDGIPIETLDGFKFNVVDKLVNDTPGNGEVAIDAGGVVTLGADLDIADFPIGTIIWAPESEVTGITTGTSFYSVVRANDGTKISLGSYTINAGGNTTVRPTDDATAYITECYDFDFETAAFKRV